MTGFARVEGVLEGLAWAVEVRSVNGRSLDLRCRMAAGCESLEPWVRTAVAERFRRGSLNVTVTLSRVATGSRVRINRLLLEQLIALAGEIDLGGVVAPARLDGLLAVRGVVESGDDEDDGGLRERLVPVVQAGIATALDRLASVRREEGARLVGVLAEQVRGIAELTARAGALASVQPEALRERLRSQVALLLETRTNLPEERLAQEVALLITRCDIREELDRLAAHTAAAAELLIAGGAIGRRFDFLCQEFNREANTLCSKSSDLDLTRTGLALKAAIEQMREQVQNIE